MNKKNIEDRLIASLLVYGASKDWSPEKFITNYRMLGLPISRLIEALSVLDEDDQDWDVTNNTD